MALSHQLYSIFLLEVVLLVVHCVTASELVVTVAVNYTPPVDFSRPSDSDYRAGSGPVTLTCQVEGATGTVTYQWTSSCKHRSCFVTRLSPTTQSVSRSFLRAGVDDGNHTCTATDSDGGETGSGSTVMNIIGIGVWVVFGNNTVPTGTLTNNGIVIATTSNRFTFQCRSGHPVFTDPPLAEFIGLDGSVLGNGVAGGLYVHNNPTFYTVEKHPSVILVQSTHTDLTVEEEGVYTCRMRDKNEDVVEVNVGIYRNGFNIIPHVCSALPSITRTRLTFDFDSFTLTCTSTGSPATTVTWMKDGSPIYTDGTTYRVEQTLTGRRTSMYDNLITVINGNESDVGTYSCVVENALGISGLSDIVVSSILVSLTSSGNTIGGSTDYSITCTVKLLGLTGLPSITWTDPDGATIYTDSDFTVGNVTGSGSTYSSVLMFNSLKTSLTGEYGCRAELESESATSYATVAVTELLIQLQIKDIHHCEQWTLQDEREKKEKVENGSATELQRRCECGFTAKHLTDGKFQCFSDPTEVTYRARLTSTASTPASDILAYIEDWVTSGEAKLVVLYTSRSLDSTCLPIEVESFNTQECGDIDEPTTQDIPAGPIIGGVAAVVIIVAILLLIVLGIFLLVFRLRRANRNQTRRGRVVTGGATRSPWVTTSKNGSSRALPATPLKDFDDYEVMADANAAYAGVVTQPGTSTDDDDGLYKDSEPTYESLPE